MRPAEPEAAIGLVMFGVLAFLVVYIAFLNLAGLT